MGNRWRSRPNACLSIRPRGLVVCAGAGYSRASWIGQSRAPPVARHCPSPTWRDTCATLHLWTQIVGKIRLVQTPWMNHSWHVPLYVTPRGLTTSPIPHGARTFEIDVRLHRPPPRHRDQRRRRRASLPLRPQSVAEFYAAVMAALAELGLPVAHPDHAERDPGRDPVRAGPRARGLRRRTRRTRFWRALLAGRPRVQGASAPASSASAARCTSSGAASTSR